MIDGLLYQALRLPFVLYYYYVYYVARAVDDADESPSGMMSTGSARLGGLAIFAAWFLMLIITTSRYGGTPGKLLVGLRITEHHAATTPIDARRAAIRHVPWLLVLIPYGGGWLMIPIVAASVLWVSNDPERRSAYDRLAGTRVVHNDQL